MTDACSMELVTQAWTVLLPHQRNTGDVPGWDTVPKQHGSTVSECHVAPRKSSSATMKSMQNLVQNSGGCSLRIRNCG